MTLKELGIKNDKPRGWVRGKGQPKWHRVLYDMWRDMHDRVKNPKNKRYQHYKNCFIHESFNTLSGYEAMAKNQPNFQEFCDTCDVISWTFDKDMKDPNNRNYYPECMTLCTRADNNKELINRIGYSYLHSDNARKKASKSKSKPIIAYNKYSVKLYRAIKDTVVFGFDDSSISKACKGKYSYNRGHLYSGYKWHYINYKHSRKYRIKDGEYIVKNNR